MSRGVISAVTLLIIVGILVALPTAHGAACHRFVGNWTQVASAPLHAWSGAACAVVNGSLYMTQGWAGLDGGGAQFPSNDTVAYDPLSDVWRVRAQAPLAAALTQAATDGRYIYVAGGFSGYWPTAFTNVSRYDTQTDQWTALTPLPADRISGALVLVGSDLHYISGLSSETQMTADHLVLDLANASAVWVSSSAAFPDPKTHIMGSLLGDTIVIPGGQYGEEPSTTAQDQNTTHGFNVLSLTWSTLAPLPAPRTVYASSVWDGRLVVAGGRNWTAAGYTVHSDVLEFALDENAWYAIGALPIQNLGACIGYFPEVTIRGVQGSFLVVSGGGVDWNLFGNSTWIIQVENLCPPVATSPPPAPSDAPTASPTATSDSTLTSTTSAQPTVTATGKVSSGSTSSDSTSRGAATTGQIGGLTSGATAALHLCGAVAVIAASIMLSLA